MNKGLFFVLILIYFFVILSGLVIYKSDKTRHVVDLVICRYKERLDRLDVLKEMEYLNHIYIMEKQLDPPLAPTTLGQIRVIQEHSPNNVGREGFSYVQWIIEHYYNLPDYVIFSQANTNDYTEFIVRLKNPSSFSEYSSFGSGKCEYTGLCTKIGQYLKRWNGLIASQNCSSRHVNLFVKFCKLTFLFSICHQNKLTFYSKKGYLRFSQHI